MSEKELAKHSVLVSVTLMTATTVVVAVGCAVILLSEFLLG